jgi:hypothetical protein
MDTALLLQAVGFSALSVALTVRLRFLYFFRRKFPYETGRIKTAIVIAFVVRTALLYILVNKLSFISAIESQAVLFAGLALGLGTGQAPARSWWTSVLLRENSEGAPGPWNAGLLSVLDRTLGFEELFWVDARKGISLEMIRATAEIRARVAEVIDDLYEEHIEEIQEKVLSWKNHRSLFFHPKYAAISEDLSVLEHDGKLKLLLDTFTFPQVTSWAKERNGWSESDKRAFERFKVDFREKMHCSLDSAECELINLSVGGSQVRIFGNGCSDRSWKKGDQLTLTLLGKEFPVEVCWLRTHSYGLRFKEEIPCPSGDSDQPAVNN